jgi:hypothetical protein
MKKNAKTLIILSAVLVVCVGAYIGGSVHNANVAKKEAAEAAETNLYPPDWGAPLKISYDAAGSTLSFTREQTQWFYDGDRDFPLKQTSVSGLSTELTTLSALRTFDAPADLSAYGLDAPSYKITVSDEGGNALTLLVGGVSGGNYYAMMSGGSKVYTIGSALVDKLEPDILKMITLDKLPALSESTIDTITLASGGRSLTLDKYQKWAGEPITWYIVEGAEYISADDYTLADGTKGAAVTVTNVLSAFSGLSFSSCAAYKPADDALSSFGLGGAGLTVTVGYTTTDSNQNETSGTAVFELGGMLPDESGCYTRLAGSDQINVIPAGKAAAFIEALETLGTET